MDTKLLKILGVVMTVAILGSLVALPVSAATEVQHRGTIEKIIKVDMIPHEMLRMKLMEHGIVKILKVDGVWVLLTKDTDREGDLMVGAEIDARGTLKKVLAETVTVTDETDVTLDIDGLDVTLTGTIEKIFYRGPEITGIKVYGIKVIICPTTMLEGMLKVGAGVEVEGTVKAFLADEIRVR